jgi:multidrug resistance protein, MATE family
MTAIFAIQAIVLLNTKNILLLIGQPQDVCELTQKFIYYLLPGVFMYIQFEITRRFLFCQGVYNSILYIMLATCLLHICMLLLLVNMMKLEILGAALATTITFTVNYIAVYTVPKAPVAPGDTWFFLDKAAYSKISIFLKYSLPASFMSVMDWWGLDVICIFAGWIGVKPLAASIIMFQMIAMLFMNSLGITFAATSLVGNSLGANLPNKARIYSLVTMYFGTA